MKAKKSLGQNFLKGEFILKKIVETGEINEDDIILEIGPGKGALTKKLLESTGKVVAIEKDNQLFEFLQEKFAEQIANKKLILINDDILSFNPSYFLPLNPSPNTEWGPHDKKIRRVSAEDSEGACDFFDARVPPGTPGRVKCEKITSPEATQNYKIIANIPYNITGAIFKKFLTAENQPSLMVLMVQHEVAKRVVASEKESILSISVKAYGQPKMIMKVDKRYFSPAPKVNSAVIKISNINRKIFTDNNINEEKFWEIVKKGFAHKRKKLSGNLKNVISGDKLTTLGLQNKRAENLTLKDWILLTK